MQTFHDKFVWVMVRWTTALRALQYWKHETRAWADLAEKLGDIVDVQRASVSCADGVIATQEIRPSTHRAMRCKRI